MTTGYNIREGSLMLVERMEEVTYYGVFTQLGECYAIRESEIEAAHARRESELYLDEAVRCGHPLAAGWAQERLPLIVRLMTALERYAALEYGTPTLDREP